jgi:hypothetical protein
LLRSGQALSLFTSFLVPSPRVAILIQDIRLRAPKVLLGFIRLLTTPSALQGREVLGFLSSRACGLCTLAAQENGSASDYAKEEEIFHISNLYNESEQSCSLVCTRHSVFIPSEGHRRGPLELNVESVGRLNFRIRAHRAIPDSLSKLQKGE